MTHKGTWLVEYTLGDRAFSLTVTDDELPGRLADRYSIENRVTYVGPEVEETNIENDFRMAKWIGSNWRDNAENI